MDPFKEITWECTTQKLIDKQGKVIWEQEVEYPNFFSDTARTVVSEKYLCNSAKQKERSLKQLINRVSDQIAEKGIKYGYFNKTEAEEFANWLKFLQVHQYFAFNSPVYFNAGLSDKPQLSACLTYDSPVNCPEGFREIGDIVERKLIGQKVLDDDGICEVENVAKKGIRPVWKITDQNGYHLKVTADHLVASPDEGEDKEYSFKRAGDLSINSYMRLKVGSSSDFSPSSDSSSELALVGWFQTEYKEGQDWFCSYMNKVFPDVHLMEKAYVEQFRDFVSFYGLEGPNKVPIAAYTNPIPYLKAIFQSKEQVILQDESLPFLEGIQTILMGIGIPSSIDNYVLHLQKFHGSQSDKVSGSYMNTPIRSIEYLGELETYDIQTSSEKFLVNNLLVHNCFIGEMKDHMTSITAAGAQEAQIFKSGSGSGMDYSSLRSSLESVRSAGNASGPVSFLKGHDTFAGVIRSGGVVRRSAKMAVLDVSHGDIEDFIKIKSHEENKLRILETAGIKPFFKDSELSDEVSFQNTNLSVKMNKKFLDAVKDDADWDLIGKSGQVLKTLSARSLMQMIGESAHTSAEPGVHFTDTINEWHVCPSAGEITSSNPCQIDVTRVLTPDGIRLFEDISVGSIIWSGHNWTSVTRKEMTGIKPVYKYSTGCGYFVGTASHNIFEDGKKIEVDKAIGIDTCIGPLIDPKITRDPQAILDGLYIGNGGPNNILYVWERDEDYFTSEIGDFLTDKVNSEYQSFYIPTDLPYKKTCDREIPLKYLKGSPDTLCNFLRGLFSANGSVMRTGLICLKQTSHKLIQDVQLMLNALGLPSHITYNDGIFRLDISVGLKFFYDHIGFLQIYKMEKLATVLETLSLETLSLETSPIYKKEFLGNFEVYSITVDDEKHRYWSGGLLTANCSEFFYINNSACNLVSINLVNCLYKNYKHPAVLKDISVFEHVINICITAQDIICSYAEYPSEEIRQISLDHRPLGLGFTNLGGLLMLEGIPYGSAEGCDRGAYITNKLSSLAYKQSSLLAEKLGSYKAYNEKEHYRILKKHRAAANEKGLSTRIWDDLIKNKTPLRNAQVSLLAPTGCRSLFSDIILADGKVVQMIDLFKYNGIDIEKIVDQGTLSKTFIDVSVDTYVKTRLGGKRISKLFVNGLSPAYKVKFSDGYVDILSETHRLLTRHLYWAYAADFKLGDEFYSPKGTISITEIELVEEFTVDIEVEDIPEYTSSNGLINHNTISFLMDAATFGIEPEYSLTRFKSMVGGGYLKIVSNVLKEALSNLDYPDTVCEKYLEDGHLDISPVHMPIFACANDINYIDHLNMMASCQPFLSGSISKCVVGNTIIPTTRGMIPIEKFNKLSIPDTYDDLFIEVASTSITETTDKFYYTYKTETTDKFYYGGERDTWKIYLADGRILEGTDIHSIKTVYDNKVDWTSLDELSISDYVPIPVGYNVWSTLDASLQTDNYTIDRMNQDLAWLLGICLGCNSDSMVITSEDPAILEKGHQIIFDQFGEEGPISENLKDFMHYLGCGEIPWSILESTRGSVIQFVKGVYANSLVSSDQDKITLSLKTRESAERLQLILNNFGIFCTIESPTYLTICESDRHIFSNLFITDTISEITETQYSTKVIKIERSSNKVYDFHIPSNHTFIGNGIINHNTVNMPNDSTVEDIIDLYFKAHEMGLKSVIVYRDGSKVGQVLTTGKEVSKEAPHEGIRKALPPDRLGGTHKFVINNSVKGYINYSTYEDGELGEFFTRIAKEGSTLSGLLDSLATLTSVALQYGVPLETLVEKMINRNFEPAGMTQNPDIRFTKSIVDYIFKYLGHNFLKDDIKVKLGLTKATIDTQVTQSNDSGSMCPVCGSQLRRLGSCEQCTECGFSGGSCS